MKSIVHPYRKSSPTEASRSTPGEELIFYVALCVIGAIPVAGMIARGGVFGVEPTIGLIMMVAGIAGLLAAGWVALTTRPGSPCTPTDQR